MSFGRQRVRKPAGARLEGWVSLRAGEACRLVEGGGPIRLRKAMEMFEDLQLDLAEAMAPTGYNPNPCGEIILNPHAEVVLPLSEQDA